MARVARLISESGYYHVMLRGNGRQVLFDDDFDMKVFICMVSRRLEKYAVEMIAWCLMWNHVHLLIRDDANALSDFMHSLTTAYARHYNERSDRVGHVFQERFKSVPINDDAQLLTVFKYVHLNPEKAGICPAKEYRWSSYSEYSSGRPKTSLCDTSIMLDLLGGKAGFEKYIEAGDDSMEELTEREVSNDDALWVAKKALCGRHPNSVASLTREDRNQALVRLWDVGLNAKQIVLLTGIGRSTIYRVLASSAENSGTGSFVPNGTGEPVPGVPNGTDEPVPGVPPASQRLRVG